MFTVMAKGLCGREWPKTCGHPRREMRRESDHNTPNFATGSFRGPKQNGSFTKTPILRESQRVLGWLHAPKGTIGSAVRSRFGIRESEPAIRLVAKLLSTTGYRDAVWKLSAAPLLAFTRGSRFRGEKTSSPRRNRKGAPWVNGDQPQ